MSIIFNTPKSTLNTTSKAIQNIGGDCPPSGGCPDWSTIGWDCDDVENSTLAANVAYTAQKKAEFDAGTITNFTNDTNLVFAPKITLPSNSSNLFYKCSNAIFPKSFDGHPVTINDMFRDCNLNHQPVFDWSQVISAYGVFANGFNLKGVDFNPVVNAPRCTTFTYAFASYPYGINSLMTTATVNAPLAVNCDYMFEGNKNLTTANLTLGAIRSAIGMFHNCTSLTTAPELQFDNTVAVNILGMFDGCTSITQFPNYDYTNVQGWYNTNDHRCPFSGTSITTIPSFACGCPTNRLYFGLTYMPSLTTVGTIDLTNALISNIEFIGSDNITTLGGFTNIGGYVRGMILNDVTIDLSNLTSLTKQSILNVINAAYDRSSSPDKTATIKLSATSYALLDASDIAIATAKNWTVTSA